MDAWPELVCGLVANFSTYHLIALAQDN